MCHHVCGTYTCIQLTYCVCTCAHVFVRGHDHVQGQAGPSLVREEVSSLDYMMYFCRLEELLVANNLEETSEAITIKHQLW